MPSNLFDDYWQLRMRSASARLEAAQKLISHKPTRGAAAEQAVRQLLADFLPWRCGVGGGFIVNHRGKSSRQVDVLLFDLL